MAEHRMRVAVVGANGSNDKWADNAHIPAVKAVEEAELTAVCTSNDESAKRAQAKYGTKLAFGDYHELMHSPDIDLVTVGVRVSSHYPVAMEALRHGKHVLCEWPLGVNAAQAAEMAALAASTGVRAAVDTQAYWSPGIMLGKELMAQEYVGRPLQFNMYHYTASALESRPSHREWQSRDEEGGAITIGSGHALAILRWYMGDLAEVCGVARTLIPEMRWSDTGETAKVTSFDTLMCVGRLTNDAMGTIHASHAAYGGEGFRLAIYGTKGRMVVETRGMVQYSPAKVYAAKGNDALAEIPIPAQLTQVKALTEQSRAFQLAQLLRGFILSIRANDGFHPNFDDAVRLHHTIEAIRHSSISRTWESVASS